MNEQITFQKIVRTFSDLYVNYRGRYVVCTKGRMHIPHIGNTEETCKLTDAVIAGHLNRRYAVAVYAGPHASKFVCFDVDLNDKDLVHTLIDSLVEFGFPRDRIYVSTSGGKGFHVEMFFTDVVYTNHLIDMYETICEDNGFDTKKVEFRPTSKMSIKLPLSVHGKTGNVCWYLDPETLEPIEDIAYVMSIRQIDRDWATELIKRKRKVEMLDCPEMTDEDHIPKGSPVELTRFDTAFPVLLQEGTRHNLMVSIGVDQRYRGVAQEKIVEVLMEWAAAQNQELIKSSPAEVRDDAEKIAAWVWGPKFSAGLKPKDKNIFFTEYDVAAVASLSGQTKKRVLFLLIAFCRRFTIAVISAKRIARYVGATERGVIKAIADLEQRGLISHTKGKKVMYQGKMITAPNRYVYNNPRSMYSGQHFLLGWDFKEETFETAYLEVMNGKDNH